MTQYEGRLVSKNTSRPLLISPLQNQISTVKKMKNQ